MAVTSIFNLFIFLSRQFADAPNFPKEIDSLFRSAKVYHAQSLSDHIVWQMPRG